MIFRQFAVALALLLSLWSFANQPATAHFPPELLNEMHGAHSLAPILEHVTPSVVSIAVHGHVAAQRNPLFEDPFFRRFFNAPEMPAEREFYAAGSGVVVDAENGYVITNNHVVENAEDITVKLPDGRSLEAERVGTDPEADIAVIRVSPEKLSAIPLGDSEQLNVGDFVLAVGNPFGLGQTVTSGIVSALERTGLGIEGYEDFIQTDASINPGNSGGALVDLRGHLIGINTAIIGPSGGNIGIGFAIPINMARAIMTQLIRHGEVRRGQLGIHIQDLTPDIADALGVETEHGAVVAKVEEGSPAADAGLQAGDVIVSVNEEPVKNASDLRNTIGLANVDEPVSLGVKRDNQTLSLTAKLSPRRHARQKMDETDPRLAGVVLGAIEEGSPLYGRVQGVEVLEIQPGIPAWRRGLREGDVITAVNRQAVRAPGDVMAAANGRDVILLQVWRDGGVVFLAIR